LLKYKELLAKPQAGKIPLISLGLGLRIKSRLYQEQEISRLAEGNEPASKNPS
jgi:hypothetical protein